MRLSIFSTMAEAPWGGSEELWAGTATAALKQGWQVQACLPGFKDVHPKRAALVKAGVVVTSWTYDDIRKWNVATANPSASADSAALSPYRCLIHPKPDLLIISHGGLMDMVNGHGGMLSELWSSGVPYVVIIQANTEGYWPNDTQRHFMRNYFAGALQVVFVSRQNLEFARRQVVDPLTNAVVWQQPVNLASLQPVKWPKEPVLQLASVARLDVGSKGQDMLLEILSTPAWRGRSWKLNLYGTGPSAGLLQETTVLNGISDRVRFHGQVSDVAQIWRDNHVLVMPSRVEGTPLALLEALCCGRPALAADVGGSADWLMAGKTGFIAQAPRTEQLSEALEELWQNRSALPGMGEAAALFIEQSFHPRPGESLLNYLAAELRAHPKAGTIGEASPFLSIVRIVSKKAPSEFSVGFTNNAETETVLVFAGSSAQGTEGGRSRIIHEPLKNPAVAANTGLLAARGEFALLVEDDEEIPEEYLNAALAALKAKDAPTLVCAKPSVTGDGVPLLGIFSLHTWRSAGGYPANSQANFQAWFWRRLKARGEKAEPASKVPSAKRAPKLSGQPRVSVVVTCYNYARYLERCIDSVLAQDFDDFEVVIVNDGSTDISPLVADWIAGLHPDKIRVLHQANSGQPAISRNNGIQIARGELILPLDADDWIAPSMLRECVAVLDADASLSVAYTDTLYCHELGQTQIHPAGEFSIAALRENNRLSCCSLFRKKVWTKVGGYRTNVRGYEDWDYWLAAAAAGFNGRRIAKPLFFYRAKGTGVYSETVANDKSRRARIKLNNPSCYSVEERQQAEAFLDSELSAKNALPMPVATETLDTLRQKASACYQAGEWAGCIDACAQALKLAPDDCDVLLVYADALAKTGQVPAALATMERVIRLEPDIEDHKQMRAGFSAMLTTTAPTGLVSVIIPCYKQAEFLGEAVESVIAQTYSNWEIIIVNDGSPDDTTAVAQLLILQRPMRTIRLVEKANGGLSDARNAGIAFAQGEFILPLDADDKIHPEFLAKTVALLGKNPDISIAYTDWLYFGAHQTLRHAIDYNFERLCTKENLFTCTSLYRKAAWTAAGGYNTNMTKGLEDWDFWISCGKRGFTGKRIPEPLFFYRAKAGSMIQTVQPHVRTMFARIVLNHADIYNDDLVANARKTFAAANLPPPKPSSVGIEWLKPEKNLPSFQQAMEQAETAVREQRLNEALAHVETALRVSPDSESTARANEIKSLLAGAGIAASENQAEAPADSGEIFGADEVKTIERLIAAHAENPGDAAVRSQLEELQQGLMNFLVTAETEKLETLFKGTFGRVFRALSKSGLVAEPPTEKSQAQVAILDEAIATPSSAGALDYRPVLARMLCTPAHRGSLTIPLGKIPGWLHDDYLAHVLHAPAVFVHGNEAEEYHDHMLAWARAIFQLTRSAPNDPAAIAAATFFATKASYIPLYFSNRNTREAAEKRAAIMEFFLLKNGAAIDFKAPKRPKDRKKIKIGYLSAHFGQQTETHVTLPTLQLDRQKFEICLFALHVNPGPVEDRCRSFADSFTPLPSNIHQQVKTIRDAALDVVIIGTNVTAVTNQISLIALHRLAPLQLVNYCSPVSTGMRHIDGYLSGTLNALPGLQDHFTEKLQFCDGPPGCLDYTVETKTTSSNFTRAGLGLNENDVVFVNAAACFKILPEMQETWAKILKAVPNSRLLLLPFNPNWSSTFPVKQFERTLTEACARHGVTRERFVLAGSLPSRADVKALEQVADVYLDTFPFSGSISVIDPLELGLPPVIREGKTHRSRMAAALLRELEIPELIVQDEASYIALSTKLATDKAFRQQMGERILAAMARKPKFTSPQSYAQGLGELIEQLVTGKKSAATAGVGA